MAELAAITPPGIKGRRPAGQRPTALMGGRFGDVILRAERSAGLRHKVNTTNAGAPTRGRALPGSVGCREIRVTLRPTFP